MKIGIDIQGAQTISRFRGIGRYTLSLVKAMLSLGHKHQFVLIGNANLPVGRIGLHQALEGLAHPQDIVFFSAFTGIEAVNAGLKGGRARSEIARQNFIDELELDALLIASVFEGGMDDAVVSISSSGHCITSAILYDLIPLAEPTKYLGVEWASAWYHHQLASLGNADLLFAISEHTRSDAMGRLQLSPGKVVNISGACDDKFKRQLVDPMHAPMESLGLPEHFILYAGAFDARKNLNVLLDGYWLLPPQLKSRFALVLVGKLSADERAEIERQIDRRELRGKVYLTGYLPDDVYLPLLRSAALFVFPSLQEGFGLPPLEAMNCGVPTIAANSTSLPEVIGTAQALFDPQLPEELASLIVAILEDEAFRTRLLAEQAKQAGRFSWEASARKVLDALEALHSLQAPLSRAECGANSSAVAARRGELIEALVRVGGPMAKSEALLLAEIVKNNEMATQALRRHISEDVAHVDWRIEGPFDSTYSLAIVNREFSLALSSIGVQVALHSSEGPGDFTPKSEFLAHHPEHNVMYQRSLGSPGKDGVVSRNMYPPRVLDLDAEVPLIHCYGWEESGFPREWVSHFNDTLAGIGCLSQHVKKTLIDNGVTVPLWVSSAGVDHWERVQSNAEYRAPGTGFRFLHVSSCFPRKGVVELLDAFGTAFTGADDVCLIIKTFPNIHNQVDDWLRAARAKFDSYPVVWVINEDLRDADLKSLYEQCQVVVAPSKAEGFGLPLAEAMLCGKEVITTAWSGQLDFCDDETAWLVDFEFEDATSHLDVSSSYWARPNVKSLSDTMRRLQRHPELLGSKSLRAKTRLQQSFKWTDAARRMLEGARNNVRRSISPPKVGWISTINTRCGIAAHSSSSLAHFPSGYVTFAPYAAELVAIDDASVVRCWDQTTSDSLNLLHAKVNESGVDTLVIQFNYGFFEFSSLSKFIEIQLASGKIVVVVLHATEDPPHAGPSKHLDLLQTALVRCTRVIVHSIRDLNRLKAIGIVDNVMLFPLGVVDVDSERAESATRQSEGFVVATYGFLLPNKGFSELIEAVSMLRSRGRHVSLRMVNAIYPALPSEQLKIEVMALVDKLSLQEVVDFHFDYVEDHESLRLLDQADLVVYPYQRSGESASAAVRHGIASRRPVAVTPLPIFGDVSSCVIKLPGTSPAEMAAGIEQIMDAAHSDSAMRATLQSTAITANTWLAHNVYSNSATRLYDVLTALANDAFSQQPS